MGLGLEGSGGGGSEDFDSVRFGLSWNCVSLCICVPLCVGGGNISSSDVQSIGEIGETGVTGDTTVSFFGLGGSLELAGALCCELAGRRANRSSESDQSQSSFGLDGSISAGIGFFLGVSMGWGWWDCGVGLRSSLFFLVLGLLTTALGGVETTLTVCQSSSLSVMASTRTTGVEMGEISRWIEFKATSLEEIVLLFVKTFDHTNRVSEICSFTCSLSPAFS